jgi:hypothetical protein
MRHKKQKRFVRASQFKSGSDPTNPLRNPFLSFLSLFFHSFVPLVPYDKNYVLFSMPYSTRYSATFQMGHTLTSCHSTSTHRSKRYEPFGPTPFPCIEFDYIWYGTYHNDPKRTVKIPSSYLHYLLSYDCHRQIYRHLTFTVLMYRRKNCSARVMRNRQTRLCHIGNQCFVEGNASLGCHFESQLILIQAQ